MPYITKEQRAELDLPLAKVAWSITTLGELNYAMTVLAREFVSGGGHYEELNAVHGTFHSAAAEFYRRVVAPYEDAKIEENGDVY